MNKPKHPRIQMNPVKSSQIHAIGFDPVTNTIAVQFKKKDGAGTIYHYPNCTPEQFHDFTKAESVGKYFGANLKGNPKHPHFKVEE